MKTRAAVQRAVWDVAVEELPVPKAIGGSEVLLRLEGCDACGADYE